MAWLSEFWASSLIFAPLKAPPRHEARCASLQSQPTDALGILPSHLALDRTTQNTPIALSPSACSHCPPNTFCHQPIQLHARTLDDYIHPPSTRTGNAWGMTPRH
jgi:hypothetical protein